MITAYHAKYYAHELTRQHAGDSVDRLSQSLFDASVDLNPHQIDAALFALRNPLQQGVLLADEVGLGKTIEAGLILCQYWAERRRRLLVVCPASLRKQWAQELTEKFNLPSVVLDAKTIRQMKLSPRHAFEQLAGKEVVIVSYHYAARLEDELVGIPWNLVVIDEAHKLRNAHRASNRMGQALRRAFEGRKKVLLTATPMQNSLMELYGLSTLLDEHLFGDEKVFRKQYMGADGDLEELGARLQGFAKRTLRRQVLEYVPYTERHAITQPFNPSEAEHALYEAISAFLQKEDSYALPRRQRHLTGLILRKLLASSPVAVIATLQVIRARLQGRVDGLVESADFLESLIEEEEMGDDYFEEAEPEELTDEQEEQASIDLLGLQLEITEIDAFIERATALREDTKAQALLTALDVGFAKMAELSGPRKTIVFTESKHTQAYLAEFLEANGYAGKVVTFNGQNTSPESTRHYQNWLAQYKETDRATGSPQVDRRTALIDHFRDHAEIMIATEAAAEGVNLQFCALVINYDLPWNPQRIEQRIGRCHRYGQRFDVVVINFLNTRNQADQRVLELLTEKFQLFSGVFGASDEVLGSIESGLDFERRIQNIYDTCRQPGEIEAAFEALQKELESNINEQMHKTQSQLIEHFDEDVHDRLRIQLNAAEARLDRIGRWFWGTTRYALRRAAQFDEGNYSFFLNTPPIQNTPAGSYQLVRGGKQNDMLAHAYRLNHVLGEWVVEDARSAETPVAEVIFDYSKYSSKLSVIEELKGTGGWLRLDRLALKSLDASEKLIFTAVTDDGRWLDQEACERLWMIPAKSTPKASDSLPPETLLANSHRRLDAEVAVFAEENERLFGVERDKLDKWADDKVLSTEAALSDTKSRIQQLKRDARKASSLDEQAVIQQNVRELERLLRKQRQEIFDVEDEIIERRDELIDSLHERLKQTTENEHLFTVRWEII